MSETKMLRSSAQEIAKTEDISYAEAVAGIAHSNLQSRLVQPEEIAGLVAFLCSEAACGITMEDIQVNAAAPW